MSETPLAPTFSIPCKQFGSAVVSEKHRLIISHRDPISDRPRVFSLDTGMATFVQKDPFNRVTFLGGAGISMDGEELLFGGSSGQKIVRFRISDWNRLPDISCGDSACPWQVAHFGDGYIFTGHLFGLNVGKVYPAGRIECIKSIGKSTSHRVTASRCGTWGAVTCWDDKELKAFNIATGVIHWTIAFYANIGDVAIDARLGHIIVCMPNAERIVVIPFTTSGDIPIPHNDKTWQWFTRESDSVDKFCPLGAKPLSDGRVVISDTSHIYVTYLMDMKRTREVRNVYVYRRPSLGCGGPLFQLELHEAHRKWFDTPDGKYYGDASLPPPSSSLSSPPGSDKRKDKRRSRRRNMRKP